MASTDSLVAPNEPAEISMREAVGYDAIECIQEASPQDQLVLKHDRFFLLLDSYGDLKPAGSCGLGLFYDDTRILSHSALRFSGGSPALLSSQVPEMFQAQVDLAITDREFGGLPWDPKNSIHIRREFLLKDGLLERVTLTSYLTSPIDLSVELALGCDFADIFEVRGWRRQQRGQFFPTEVGERSLAFRYRGRDGRRLRTEVRFAEAPDELDARGARWHLRLEPATRQVLEWRVAPERALLVRPSSPAAPSPAFEENRAEAAARYASWRTECTQWHTDVEEFNTTLRHAVDDLRALYTEADGEQVISAGIPWYSTAFGRDSIITALQTLSVNPRIAIDTLRYLARRQGRREDPFTEEQPGKILHELRRGEMARAGEIPHVPYYGTIDATPLWLVLLHETWRWTGNRDLLQELMPHAEQALEWIDRYGDIDGDGFVEYARSSDQGLVNQGWKDSGDGVPFPDGRLPEPPIALVEVQGYVYDAKMRAAQLFRALGREAEAEALRRQAATLRQRILDSFWLEEEGTFALALDGRKRPIPTVTTNAGHLLWSRVPTPEQAARMAELFLSPEMFSGWGIRTLSSAHPVFNPMSYHNGSVWPHDNAIVVMGLSQYGHSQQTLPVIQALHDAAFHMRFHRLPELFCGMQRGYGMRPVLYPVSCSPQAWASGSFFLLLQAVTGIRPEAPAGVLHIREPQLPRFLRELTLSGLSIGDSRVSLQFRRQGSRTLANLLSVEGAPLQVRIELS